MPPAPSFSCPLCSISLTAASLHSHLRQELRYPSTACLLCPLTFTSTSDAQEHSAEEHPGRQLRLLRLEKDGQREERLRELVRLAEGGRRELEERLCVCGQCQLLCREGFGQTSAQSAAGVAGFEMGANENQDQESMAHQERNITEATFILKEHSEQYPDAELGPAYAEQPKAAEEESEEEPQAPMDVKPNLEDLKPQINVDGRVACVQCGMRVDKAWFKQHAVWAHSTARPFSCNLCPHNEKTKGALVKHQLKEHETELSEETFTFAGSEDKIRQIVEQCFGSTKETDWARLRCQPCDKLINAKEVRNHAARVHLKKPLHTCRLCGFEKTELSAGNMNKHVQKHHKRQPGPDTVDSSQAQHYAPIIKNMIPQLFSKE